MRLIAGHGRAGLVGIKEQGGIPECYGIHGVYESGGLQVSNFTYPRKTGHPVLKQPNIETGGIKIYRPMLSFSKDRLIATCKYEKMEWFEDHTNKDPTLTKRNAIRHMYNSHSMPAALSKPALLDLSRRMKDSVSNEDALVSLLLSKSTINSFNTRTGTVKVRFPTAVHIRAASGDTKADCRHIAAKLLRRALFLVSPLEHIKLATLDGAVTQIFPSLMDPQKQVTSPKPLTVASVYLQPIHKSIRGPESVDRSPNQLVQQINTTNWLLSRQPYSNSSNLPIIPIPPPDGNTWTPWQLFDGRYWIRIQYLNSSYGPSLIIRPFRASDLKRFKASLDEHDQRMLDNLRFSTSTKGNIRWTVPALVMRGPSNEQKHVLALPTLGVHEKIADMWVKWEVRYKKVELPGIEFAQSVELEKGTISSTSS
jgi:tRNA(Ile)-lysidine synthase